MRYIRNMQLDGFGQQGQSKLAKSSVLVVGAGALGSVCTLYLVGAGVGKVHVADFDNVDITNLQRQPAFTMADIGKNKAVALAERCLELNPEIEIEAHAKKLDIDELRNMLMGNLENSIDLVVEGSDNASTKYAVATACEECGIPYVLGGVAQFRGQVLAWIPGKRGYLDLFPDAAESSAYKTAAQGGVFGPVPGVIASLQAAEAIKILSGYGTPLLSRIITYYALESHFNEYEF